MGLRERIQEERARIAADPAVIQAARAAQKAQIKLEQEWETQRKIEALAAKQEAEQKAALTTDLKKLLEIVGARELLTEVRKDWNVGRVDKKPAQIPDVVKFFAGYSHDRHLSPNLTLPPKLPAMLLALRYKFRDVESVIVSGGVEGSYLLEHELALHAIVGREETGLPFVATLTGLQRAGSLRGRAYRFRSREPFPRLKEDGDLCISHGQPETIFPTDSDKSRKILEDQLFERVRTFESPLKFADEAKERVLSDWSHLPAYARNTVSTVWYKGIPSRVLDGLVEFDKWTHNL